MGSIFWNGDSFSEGIRRLDEGLFDNMPLVTAIE
jgi:hypothetical protein